MRDALSILLLGDLTRYTRSEQRLRALQELGHAVRGISLVASDDVPGTRRRSILERARSKVGLPPDLARANERVLAELRAAPCDVLWVEKGLCLRAETLRAVRRSWPDTRLVFFSEDDMAARHNQSRHFLSALPLYDDVFTTKSKNVEGDELEALGARRVHYVPKTFDPSFHRPLDIDPTAVDCIGSRVGFVGTFELERAEALLFLAENGIPVRVWGNGWGAWRDRHPVLRVEGRPVWGEDYVQTLNATDVNLGFLRRQSQDRHTDRSVEIPACGAFLLAERSDEHRALLAEGHEADYFEGQGELLYKVRYWLENPQERRRVAAAGRARLLADGRTHREALVGMLEVVLGRPAPPVEEPPAALPSPREGARRSEGVLGG